MPLSSDAALSTARRLRERQHTERGVLDPIRRYWTGRQALPRVIPSSAPAEVHEMARMARVNVLGIVVDSLSQSLFVDGFRAKNDEDNADVWAIWQANRLDARQSGIHRAALAYGTSYAVVLPGDPVPVIRGVSPRSLTAEYGDDPDWPVYALERRGRDLWRLYDESSVYTLRGGETGDRMEYVGVEEHGSEVTPVVRFVEVEDLDAEEDVTDDSYRRRTSVARIARGQVSPLMSIQDQIDLITFNLLVAQHYSAFRQRYIIGWVAEDEEARAKASASQLWTFDEDPERMKVGEFGETSLGGYIASREASLRHAATLSQTPAHELIGELVNLSAEALAAAEAGRDRKVSDRETLFGEAHEQALRLAGGLSTPTIEVPQDSQVVWRDTSARAFGAVVDALGKLVTMLGIPPEELWERVPGATQADVSRWKARAAEGDALGNLTSLLDRQAGGETDPSAEMKAKADAMGVLIRAGATPESAARQVGLDQIEFSGAVPTSLRFPADDASGLEGSGGAKAAPRPIAAAE